MKRSKKHQALMSDYEKEKQKKLAKLADKILKQDEINQKLREKNINTDFLDLF